MIPARPNYHTSILNGLRNLVSNQQMLSKSVSLFNFKRKKKSVEYERIWSWNIGSAYHHILTTVASLQDGDFIQI